MRVIAGSKKGFKLKGPKSKDIRPTEDRIKESLFNILGYIDENSLVLDLFAGTGSIGIEFLSRGAKKVYFVDKSYESIRCIDENLKHTCLKDSAEILKKDAFKALDLLREKDIKFDYIFIDPPYGRNLLERVLIKIDEVNILREEGLIVLEHERNYVLNHIFNSLIKIDSRNYGDKSLSFFKKRDRREK